ncbi:ATP-binding protein [Bacillus spizizenii]|uniref:ATP-binding protein n=1 Tax=Bacillus spizizenii TaxID=96241 RepID=UPI000B449AE4|nr:ATP-binding protein [Bacillus spizizenii]OUL04680.1 Keratin, type I cytoskeletal 18 [Bacillus spizizenii]
MPTSLKSVFGISRNVLKSYVDRQQIDEDYQDKIELTDHHIVIYGETKVGKTLLRKKYVTKDENTIVIDCTKGVNLSDIYTQILYKAGIEISESLSKSIEKCTKLDSQVEANLFQFIKAKVSGESTEKELSSETRRVNLPNTVSVRVAEALVSKEIQFIVLDDFHYLNLVDQYLLAFDLKMFYQIGLRFIIIGTKINNGYFEKFNGELAQRIDYIDATRWSKNDLLEIKKRGCRELNIDISDDVINYFVEASSHIVAVYQQLLFDYCRESGVRQSSNHQVILNDLELAIKCNKLYYKRISEEYLKRIQHIADGERKGKLKLYYYIMKIVLTSNNDVARKGFSFQYIYDNLLQIHMNKTINHGALTSVLNHFEELQTKKNVFPKVFSYYDKRLYITDSLFYYILKHFDKENIDEVLPPHDFQLSFNFNN